MINTITLVGNVSLDGKFYDKNGFTVYSNSLCFKERYKGGYRNQFVKFKAIKPGLAKSLNKHLSKGSKVTIQGALSLEKFEDETRKYSEPVIILSSVDIHTKFINDKEVVTEPEVATFSQEDMEALGSMSFEDETVQEDDLMPVNDDGAMELFENNQINEPSENKVANEKVENRVTNEVVESETSTSAETSDDDSYLNKFMQMLND